MANLDGDPRCVHAEAIKNGVVPTPQTRAFFNNLITRYARFDAADSAFALFRTIPCPNVVTWTSIISAFADSPQAAINLFLSMLRSPRRSLPNARTFSTLLRTCASLPDNRFAPQLQSLSLKLSALESPFVGSAFVSLYSKIGDLDSARKVFDEMSEPDGVCFAAMINGLAQNNRPIEALQCFSDMRRHNSPSTSQSLSGALCAASGTAMLEQCRIFHGHAVVTGLYSNIYVATALIDGYGKCGIIEEARKVFDEWKLELQIAGWNALMAGYAIQGSTESVINLFNAMEHRGIAPDEYTFLAVLTAFQSTNMVAEIERWLDRMKMKYGLEPSIEHYTCLVGAMGRAGRLEEAERVALAMPYEPDVAFWRVLLSSCAINKNTDKAWKMAEKLLEINPQDDSTYVILSNMFASAAMWDEVKKVWKVMRDRGVKKEIGKSWIEVLGVVHVFFAGDRRHARMDEIYAKLKEMMMEIKKMGYAPNVSEIWHEVEEKEKHELLLYHSEKLAVAFGLLRGVTPLGKPLRIIKNLRICKDCHDTFKYISIVAAREIVVRDVQRYHRFSNGSCSCCDSW
ncbi:putative pentatricopeptide repeat-containing protein At5g52630 [Andrographis paniculata]|uniref:putative pentatricopeptide repeat-containing protein At5g52630 n=1 Tax=Andrographis paniculata TaxID=175694 RepID=UPI0021E8D1EE|nr:putative pentatricopeptide repeat-containing protein At5g52630 [Andrographis paniculata]